MQTLINNAPYPSRSGEWRDTVLKVKSKAPNSSD
jgi:hypothetical protein